jgi:hypothetical protein
MPEGRQGDECVTGSKKRKEGKTGEGMGGRYNGERVVPFSSFPFFPPYFFSPEP